MPQQDFLPVATGVGAYVQPQGTYASNPATTQGVSNGLADPTFFNKAIRQSSSVAAMITNFINSIAGLDTIDDGDLATLQTNFIAALRIVGPRAPLLNTGNYYVDGTNGNDTNAGTTLAPWKTLAHAVTFLKQLDMNNQTVNVYCANTFSAGLVVIGPFVGAPVGGPNFIFASGSSITDLTRNGVHVSEAATITINGPVAISAPATSGDTGAPNYNSVGNGLYAVSGGTINMTGGVILDSCGVGHIVADDAGQIRLEGSYTVGGDAPAHWIAVRSGNIGVPAVLTGARALSLVGTGGVRTFSSGFATASDTGLVFASSSVLSFSFPSGVVGARYAVGGNAVIQTAGSGPTFFPGSVVGTSASGGQYL